MPPAFRKDHFFSMAGGICRVSNRIRPDASLLWDAENLLPRNAAGCRVGRGDTDTTVNLSGATDLLSIYRSGALSILSRSSAGYQCHLAGTMPAVTYTPGVTRHAMAAFRSSVAMAQEGTQLAVWDVDTNEVHPVGGSEAGYEAPAGGLVAEAFGRLWCTADPNDDTTAPLVTIPFYATAIPVAQASVLKAGTCDIADHIMHDTDGADLSSYVGKIVLVSDMGFKAASAIGTDLSLTPYSGMPDDQQGALYKVIDGQGLLAYPSALDLGAVFLNNDSGSAYVRVYNTLAIPVKVTAIRPKGKEFKVSDEPALPVTVGPGQSITFKVTATPYSKGIVSGSVFIEHDFYAQSSLSVNVTCTGTTRRVLASPSAMDLGAWLQGGASGTVPVQIVNPLSYDVVLKKTGSVGFTGTKFSVVSVTDSDGASIGGGTWPMNADYTLKAGKSITINVKVTPLEGDVGGLTDTLKVKRAVPAKPFRVWYTNAGSFTEWERDKNWVDLLADGVSAGQVIAMLEHDGTLFVWKEAAVWGIQPGGITEFRPVQISTGSGVGALSQRAVCVGGGAAWFASKEGVYVVMGMDIRNVSDERLRPVWESIPADRYDEVWLQYHLGWLWVYLPSDNEDDDRVWVFNPRTQSWWKTRYTGVTGLAAAKGAGHIERLYGVVGGDLLLLDDPDKADEALDWSMTIGYSPLGEPADRKVIYEAFLYADDPELVSSLQVETDDGTNIGARVQPPEDHVVLLAGLCRIESTGGPLIIPTGGPPPGNDSLVDLGASVSIEGTESAVTANTDGSISCSHSLPAGIYLYSVTADSTVTPGKVRRADITFPPGTVGTVFLFRLAGSRNQSNGGVGDIHGLSIGYSVATPHAREG